MDIFVEVMFNIFNFWTKALAVPNLYIQYGHHVYSEISL